MTSVEGNINSLKYTKILENNLWPVIARDYPNNDYAFVDNNAPVHTSGVSKRSKEENQMDLTDWPAQSPDLNIIENV